MGNKSSLVIILETEGPVLAGDTLKGHVVVQTDKSCEERHLKLTICGKEISTMYSESHHLRRAEHCFFTNQQRIHCPQQSNSKTVKFVVPFRIQLPSTLPSSTSFPPNRKSTSFQKGMRIQYTLLAELGRLRQEIFVPCHSTYLSRTPIPCLLPPRTFSIQTLCLPRGSVTIAARMDDKQVGRGQTLALWIDVSNDSSVPINRVTAKLLEYVSWKLVVEDDGDNGSSTREESATIKLDTVDMDVGSDRLAGQRRRRDVNCNEVFSTSGCSIDMGQSILLDDSNRVCLTVPPFARDSYQGALLHVWHTVKIKLYTPTLANNASLSMNIKVGNRPLVAKDCSGVPGISPVSSLGSRTTTSGSFESTLEDFDKGGATQFLFTFPSSLSDLLMPDGGTKLEERRRREDVEQADPGFTPRAHAGPRGVVNQGRLDDETNSLLDDDTDYSEINSLAGLIPLPPPGQTSLPSLLHQMATGGDPYAVVVACLRDPQWLGIVTTLKPAEVGQIVGRIADCELQFDIVTRLATVVNRKCGFTSEYSAAVLRSVSEWNRVGMARHLIPLTADIGSNHRLLSNELPDWERMIVASEIDEAIARQPRYETKD